MNRDYYWEYMEVVDELLHEFTVKVKFGNPYAFWLDGISVEKGIVDYLWDELIYHTGKRGWYNTGRLDGVARNAMKDKLNEWLEEHYLDFQCNCKEDSTIIIEENPWKEILEPYAGEVVVLCRTEREWNYWMPLFQKWRGRIVVLISFDVVCEQEFEADILLVEHYLPDKEYVYNDYLKQKYPLLFHYVNRNVVLLETLKPRCVLLMTGCNMDGELLAILCRKRNIPSICVQQGWPSIIHTKFRNMEYDYFLTWGEEFNRLWKPWNAGTEFVAIGYLYSVETKKTNVSGIAFFLQVPVITLNTKYMEEMLELVVFCAKRFPERLMYVRQHPSERKKIEEYKQFEGIDNIVVADDMVLEELFSEITVSVSFFSSTLMESILYGAVPFVFDPSSCPGYYPEIEQEGIGLQSHSLEEAKEKIGWLLEDHCNIFLEKGKAAVRERYFTSWGEPAVDNMIRFIENV